jgi:hypothetical protein
MMIQLNPTIPVYVVGKGTGLAWFLIDYSEEHHLMWVVAMDETSEIWTVPNTDIRAQKNTTMNRLLEKSHDAKISKEK